MTTVTGTSGNDTLTGSSADDTITPGTGNDTIDGLAGTDTVVLSGARSNYNITQTFTGYLVKDTVGGAGEKTVSNVELLQFSDKIYNLSVATDAKLISTTQLNSLTELYIAYFNRVPDASGLDYWIKEYAAGKTLEDIGKSFYDAASLPEYTTRTGYSSDMTNAEFVTKIYQNVLGRSTPDQEGLDYWSTSLANGSQTRGSLISTMLGSAHSFKNDPTWGWVADLLDNKVTVGTYHAVTAGIDYAADAYANCQAIAQRVTATDTTAAISLIGLSEQTDYQSPPMPG